MSVQKLLQLISVIYKQSIRRAKVPVLLALLFVMYLMIINSYNSFTKPLDDRPVDQRYIVDTEMCKMIDWPVFDSETRPLYRNHSGRRIKCRSPETQYLTIHRINHTVIYIQYNASARQPPPQCFISDVLRVKGTDFKVTYGRQVGPIIGRSMNVTNSDAVRVQCYINEDVTKSDKNTFNTIIETKVVDQIVPLLPERKVSPKNKPSFKGQVPNVLMLGIDSISWLQFRRQFSLTNGLVEKHGFYPINGYNKIGDNTFPNLMAILTGHFSDHYFNESVRKTKYFDDLPFIWKEFAKQNFLTNFVEDMPRYSLFNYNKKGFHNKPTDYYLRPVSLVVDKKLNRFCYKDKLEIEFYYNYTYDFVNAMSSRQQKYFSFVFMAHLTHDKANYAGYADLPVYTLLSKLFENNLLNNTIVWLFSDHGIRFGKIRATTSGTLEERQPFVWLYLPPNYRQNNPSIDGNLRLNAHRLTTPFDIYATLLHIARGKSVPNLSHGKSLFDEIPVNRSCKSEQISEHWCTCAQQRRQLKSFQNITFVANFIVTEVNRLLKPLKLCKKLTLHEIQLVFESQHDSQFQYQKFYLIKLSVKPSLAVFEATVRKYYDELTIIGDISRINQYRGQSLCIKNSYLEKYCFC